MYEIKVCVHNQTWVNSICLKSNVGSRHIDNLSNTQPTNPSFLFKHGKLVHSMIYK